MESFDIIYNWIQKTDWISFLSNNKSREYLSNTGVTFKICEDWFLSKNDEFWQKYVKNERFLSKKQ